jgi:hypothetical protein
MTMDRDYQDFPPSLILGPLLKIASYCNARGYLPNIQIDVIQPKRIKDLTFELKRRKDRMYDLVHLDTHGKIRVQILPTNPSSTVATPCLRFGRHYEEVRGRRFKQGEDSVVALMRDDDSLNDIEVGHVAALFQKYKSLGLHSALVFHPTRNGTCFPICVTFSWPMTLWTFLL